MTVRRQIALTIFITGALTALGVIVTVLIAFQRFERESTYYRADAFLTRVVNTYPDLFDMQQRRPDEFDGFLRSLVLFEPDTQIYILDAQGLVLACTGSVKPSAGLRVALPPVLKAVSPTPMPYVMGDDPERMAAPSGVRRDADVAVIAAKPLTRVVIRSNAPVAGYLYLVAHQSALPVGRLAAFRSSFALPALGMIAAVVTLATLLAAWVIAAITRPLRQLSQAVAAVSQDGLSAASLDQHLKALPADSQRDEFGQLSGGFRSMLATLRTQWGTLQRLDHFRREGVSNLSHDLRSPLTATTACLETLELRWGADPARHEDRQLLEVALRNARNAARLVQSLGDLAQLDEPEFKLNWQVLDTTEVLDDIALRFAARAAQQGTTLSTMLSADGVADGATEPAQPCFAKVDIELFERAIANLVDNALKFSRPGDRITLGAHCEAEQVHISISDSGAGIASADLPHLFDRYYQSRKGSHSVAPATGEGGKGLGLAIVKRIAELHGGDVRVSSVIGQGTRVTLSLPRVN
ncbi:MAG: HAMP domain-containing histidine kinase [Pseudorhodobacter sp.]|nr:HAMP domain-containing histidine kinase [Rhizobacter sp.]